MALRRFLAPFVVLLIPISLGLARPQELATKPSLRAGRPPQLIEPEEMSWGSYRQATPSGAKVALLHGNPENVGGGQFVLRVRASNGATAGPQSHSVDLHITVLKGSLVFLEETGPEAKKPHQVGPGSYVQVPRGVSYTVIAKGDAEYQLQGIAPLKTFPASAKPPAAKKASTLARPTAGPTPGPTDDQKQKVEFDFVVAAYNKGVQANNPAAVQAARKEFERIARAGGRYASPAQQYLAARFPVEVIPQGSCPAIPVLKDRGWVVQDSKPGDIVATGLLEPKLAWTSCPAPRFPERAKSLQRPGILKLAVVLDEGGNVVNVKLRGGIAPPGYYEAAAGAVRLWKTNPPRANGVAVRTEFSVDIPFSP